jgi:hypothetical protein
MMRQPHYHSGFYDNVEELSTEERNGIRSFGLENYTTAPFYGEKAT